MIKQWNAPKGRYSEHCRGLVGSIQAGDFFRIGGRLCRLNGWRNREYFPCVTGGPEVLYMTGGHLAEVQDIGNGRIFAVAEQYIYQATE